MSANPADNTSIYQELFDHLPAGIFRTTLDGKIAYANQSIAELFGDKSPAELMKRVRNVAEDLYVNPDDRQTLIKILTEKGRTVREVALKKANGEIFFSELNIRVVKDEKGDALYLEGTAQDVTKRRETEETIYRLNTELEQRVRQRTTELEQANLELNSEIVVRKRVERELQSLVQAEQKRRLELEKLAKVSLSLRQATQSTDFLEMLTDEIQDLCDAELVAGILYRDVPHRVTKYSPGLEKTLSAAQKDAISAALMSGKTNNPRNNVPGFETTELLMLDSSDGLYGSVLVASRPAYAIAADEKNMLATIADMAGTALQRIGVLETLELRVEGRRQELVVLYNLMTIIAESWKLNDILEFSLLLTMETISINKGILYVVDSSDPQKLQAAVLRWRAPGVVPEPELTFHDVLAYKVLETKKELVLEDLRDQPAYTEVEACSYAGVPIRSRGEMRGVLSLFADDKGKFTTEVMALLSSISDHVGIGIENALLFEKTQKNNAAIDEDAGD